MRRGATYSDDKRLRWTLTREWREGPGVCFIGHNPSSAGHELDDPTSRAWVAYCEAQGYGRYVAVNLYPFRSADPTVCRRWADYEKNGPDWHARDALMVNLDIIAREAKRADRVVACWGSLAFDDLWVDSVLEEIQAGAAPWPDVYCLGLTLAGRPKHPSARGVHRVAPTTPFVLWKPAEVSEGAAQLKEKAA